MALNGISKDSDEDCSGMRSLRSPGSRGSTQIPVLTGNKRLKPKTEEQSQQRLKSLLAQIHKGEREKEELQRKNALLLQFREKMVRELEEKDKELLLLRKLAETMFKEYDQLKNKYDLDMSALNQAIQRASKWYKQNRELKRKSTVLMQKVMQIAPETVLEIEDETDSSTDQDEIANLRKNIEELNSEIARLQSELNSAKLQEFEAQEQAVDMQSALEDERSTITRLQSELQELRSVKENLGHVTKLVAQEVVTLREQCEQEKETSQRFKTDADQAKKERNILAHQSQLLLLDASSDEKLMTALLEIESLKRTLEEEKLNYTNQISILQEKLDDKDNESSEVEMMSEKLKIIESELNCALLRAERAEELTKELTNKVVNLEMELEKKKVPPPPPPPPPPTLFQSPTRQQETTVVEVADLLGLKRSAKPTLQPGAIDEIINQIKGGRFTLKRPDKPKEKKEEEPPIVKEMINILGTLRRRPGNRTPSFRRQKSSKELVASSQDIVI